MSRGTSNQGHAGKRGFAATSLRRLGVALLGAGLLALPLAGRVIVDGRAALVEAEHAATAGDAHAELRWLGRAARFALPVATHDDRAREQLVARAAAAQEAGETQLALAAWRELRRSLLGTRTLGVAGAGQDAQLRAANEQIVELMVLEARAAGEAGARERWASELAEDLKARGRSVLAAACFVVFLLASVAFFVLGLDGAGRLQARPALRIGITLLAALIAWILLI